MHYYIPWVFSKNPEQVIIYWECLQSSVSELSTSAYLHDDGEVLVIGGPRSVSKNTADQANIEFSLVPVPSPCLQLDLSTQGSLQRKALFHSSDGVIEVSQEIIDLDSDLFSRVKGIFENLLLQNKLVTVVGLGTAGSLGAVELAKCGVGRFRLADFDRLEAHNVVRHACDLADIGRLKTRALRDRILRINPRAQIELYEQDVLAETGALRGLIRGANLLFMGADTEAPRFLANRICLEEKVPAVYAGCFERAFAGEIIRVVPGETPCYECFMGLVAGRKQDLPRGPIDYAAPVEAQMKAEPGLGLDAAMVFQLQAKLALLTLLRGEDTSLEDIPENYFWWYNRRDWIFKELDPDVYGPMGTLFPGISFPYREDCLACRSDEFYAKALDISLVQVEAEAEKILEEARKNRD